MADRTDKGSGAAEGPGEVQPGVKGEFQLLSNPTGYQSIHKTTSPWWQPKQPPNSVSPAPLTIQTLKDAMEKVGEKIKAKEQAAKQLMNELQMDHQKKFMEKLMADVNFVNQDFGVIPPGILSNVVSYEPVPLPFHYDSAVPLEPKALEKVYHQSAQTGGKDEWGTPWPFFLWLDSFFDFNLDVCATEDNSKCPEFLTPEMDGKEIEWWGRVWMNPPYSEVEGWMQEMGSAALAGEIEMGCALVAARTDTKWWHYAMQYCREVWFLKGRLQFEGAKANAPFPSALVFFTPGPYVTHHSPLVRFVDWKAHLTAGTLPGNGMGQLLLPASKGHAGLEP